MRFGNRFPSPYIPHVSFFDWLANRAEEPPQADRLATVIAQAGAAGVAASSQTIGCRLLPFRLLRRLQQRSQIAQPAVHAGVSQLQWGILQIFRLDRLAVQIGYW